MQCVKLSNRNGNQLKDEDANLERRGKSSSGNVNVEQRKSKPRDVLDLIGCKTTSSDGHFLFFLLRKESGQETNIAVNQKVLKARSAAFGLIALAFSNRADRLNG